MRQAWAIEYESRGSNSPSQIQLCPGFLKKAQKRKVLGLEDQGKKPSLARRIQKINDWMNDPFKTPMDVAYRLGTTLLHEMTHAMPDDATQDIAGAGTSGSYGWKNCLRLSSDPAGQGMDNADNYALFGLASRIINPHNGAPAQRPMRDGSIQVLPAAVRPSKRHLHGQVDHVGSNTTVTIDHHPLTK